MVYHALDLSPPTAPDCSTAPAAALGRAVVGAAPRTLAERPVAGVRVAVATCGTPAALPSRSVCALPTEPPTVPATDCEAATIYNGSSGQTDLLESRRSFAHFVGYIWLRHVFMSYAYSTKIDLLPRASRNEARLSTN